MAQTLAVSTKLKYYETMESVKMNTWDKGDKIFRKQESKLYAGEAKVLRYKYMD